jgi:hypothetical protein
MEIRSVKIKEIKPYDRNAKKHDDTQINNVAESIRQFGFVQPIVIDSDGVIVIGHCRFEAAKRLKYAEVPCIMVDDLTPEQVDTLRIVDNKTNESPWDIDLLADVLPELDLDDFDFNWDIESADDYETDFTLPDGDKDEFCQMTFTLHERQKELIEYALGVVAGDISETFGNENKNGNALYEVIRQWAEQRS